MIIQQLSDWQKSFCLPATPLQKLKSYEGVDLWVKRDDLNHPVIQGNKLRKLKYNLKHAIEKGYQQLVTFGGAYSNHLLATAQAAQACGMQSLGFVRGDELDKQPQKWSQTLLQAQAKGMKFVFLNRQEYRLKHESERVKKYLSNNHFSSFLIPEGGSNFAAIKGVKEIVNELNQQIKEPNHIVSACGTGGTVAGLIEGVAQHKMPTEVIGIPVLKGATFLKQDIIDLSPSQAQVQWQLNHNYHGGGYAKSTQKIMEFAQNFSQINVMALDKIYTAKTFYATYDLIRTGKIPKGSSVVILHTGGLQGGLNQV